MGEGGERKKRVQPVNGVKEYCKIIHLRIDYCANDMIQNKLLPVATVYLALLLYNAVSCQIDIPEALQPIHTFCMCTKAIGIRPDRSYVFTHILYYVF